MDHDELSELLRLNSSFDDIFNRLDPNLVDIDAAWTAFVDAAMPIDRKVQATLRSILATRHEHEEAVHVMLRWPHPGKKEVYRIDEIDGRLRLVYIHVRDPNFMEIVDPAAEASEAA